MLIDEGYDAGPRRPVVGLAVVSAAAFRPHGLEGVEDPVDPVLQQPGKTEVAEGIHVRQLLFRQSHGRVSVKWSGGRPIHWACTGLPQ